MKSLPRARRWLAKRALPLWNTAGFDPALGLFHERLDFERRPITGSPRRLMVQSRQIATFARASVAGLHADADDRLAAALSRTRRLYHRADGAPGWIFSVDPSGRPADSTRDLYAHAFILYALAFGHRLTGDPEWVTLADTTLADMDAIFAAPHGGHLDAVPVKDATRRQNPHMHLLEAMLALHEATGAERFKARADALVSLATTRFIDPASGALLEDFTAEWRPLSPPGENRVEPGHLFEWAWLLGEYSRLGGTLDPAVAGRLVAFAETHGLDPESGCVIDAVTEFGAPMIGSTRAWPHAEGVKAYAAAARSGQSDAAARADLLLGRLLDVHLPPHLEGGWIDRFDAGGASLVDHMPASSLYHIAGAILEADLVFGSEPSA